MDSVSSCGLSRRLLLPALAVLLSVMAGGAQAQTVRVAVASNALGAIERLAQEFEPDSGIDVLISSGSTAKLYAQIVNGAPYDVFLGANEREPQRLEQAGLVQAGSRFTYAVGRLVLWSAQAGRLHENGAQVLTGGDFHYLALANPRTAPYGVAAMQVLQALGLEQALRAKIVRGENVGQAFQFVASANAELGFVAASQLVALPADRRGSQWVVPADLYTPVTQQAVVLKAARDLAAAQAFMHFLRSARAQHILQHEFAYAVQP